MLNLENVSFRHRSARGARFRVLDGVSLRVDKAELVVLCGPSGCGKTTLLRLIAGLLEQQAGTITIDGRRVRGPSPEIGIVFQSYNSFPWLSVRRNVEFSIRATVRDRVERRRIVDRHLDAMGLEKFGEAYPHALSGGMRQRVALARTLAMNPLILLLDEPFGALDALTRYALQRHLQDRALQNRWTILLVTHDVDSAILLGDRVLVLSSRPARVVREEKIPFERPRRAAIRDRRAFREIRSALLSSIQAPDVGVDKPGGPPAPGPPSGPKRFTWSRLFRDTAEEVLS